jgi:hypothetical protein
MFIKINEWNFEMQLLGLEFLTGKARIVHISGQFQSYVMSTLEIETGVLQKSHRIQKDPKLS